MTHHTQNRTSTRGRLLAGLALLTLIACSEPASRFSGYESDNSSGKRTTAACTVPQAKTIRRTATRRTATRRTATRRTATRRTATRRMTTRRTRTPSRTDYAQRLRAMQAAQALRALQAMRAMQSRRYARGVGSGSGDNFWSSRFSAGNCNANNTQGYVSVPGYGPVGYGF